MSADSATTAEPGVQRSVLVVFVGLMLVLLMAALDQTIVRGVAPGALSNVKNPRVGAEFCAPRMSHMHSVRALATGPEVFTECRLETRRPPRPYPPPLPQ